MSIRSVFGVSLGLLAGLCGASLMTSAASAQPLIVALGDSNTAGWGVGQGNAFPSQLNAMLQRRGVNARIANAGVSGDTFGGMLSRLDKSVPAGTRLVIVQGGYNDLIRARRAMSSSPGWRAFFRSCGRDGCQPCCAASSFRNGMPSAANWRHNMVRALSPAAPAIRPVTPGPTGFICRRRGILWWRSASRR